jgi:hypothetical protein
VHATVRALEAALAQGGLAEALAQTPPEAVGEPIDAVYHGLLNIDAGSAAARAPWVGRALATYASALVPARRAFEPGAVPLEAAVRARAWGVGAGAAVEQAAMAHAYRRLYEDLRGVSTIAAALLDPPVLSTDALGEALERLMHDVLAGAWPTRFAPLLEDVLEQTDLRARVPGASKRGVRVQVAATLPGPRHVRKAARARRAGVVLLSPATLAAQVPAVPGAAAQLPAGGPTVWARALRDQLTGLIARPVAWAGGPAAGASPVLVALVLAVVQEGAPGARGPKRRRRTGPLGARPAC